MRDLRINPIISKLRRHSNLATLFREPDRRRFYIGEPGISSHEDHGSVVQATIAADMSVPTELPIEAPRFEIPQALEAYQPHLPEKSPARLISQPVISRQPAKITAPKEKQPGAAVPSTGPDREWNRLQTILRRHAAAEEQERTSPESQNTTSSIREKTDETQKLHRAERSSGAASQLGQTRRGRATIEEPGEKAEQPEVEKRFLPRIQEFDSASSLPVVKKPEAIKPVGPQPTTQQHTEPFGQVSQSATQNPPQVVTPVPDESGIRKQSAPKVDLSTQETSFASSIEKKPLVSSDETAGSITTVQATPSSFPTPDQPAIKTGSQKSYQREPPIEVSREAEIPGEGKIDSKKPADVSTSVVQPAADAVSEPASVEISQESGPSRQPTSSEISGTLRRTEAAPQSIKAEPTQLPPEFGDIRATENIPETIPSHPAKISAFEHAIIPSEKRERDIQESPETHIQETINDQPVVKNYSTENPLPLEAVWPVTVQRLPSTSPRSPEMDIEQPRIPTTEKTEIPEGVEDADQIESPRDKKRVERETKLRKLVSSIEVSQPTESEVDLITPLRPRPSMTTPKKNVDVIQKKPEGKEPTPESTIKTRHAPTPEELKSDTVKTEIGPLPKDLWQLLGQPIPEDIPSSTKDAAQVIQEKPLIENQNIQQSTQVESTSTSEAPAVTIQRQETASEPVAVESSTPSPSLSDRDKKELSRRVYDEIKRRIAIEWERFQRK